MLRKLRHQHKALTVLSANLDSSNSQHLMAPFHHPDAVTCNMMHGARIQSVLVQRYTFQDKKNLTVGVLGLLGPDAAMHSQLLRPTTGYVGFDRDGGTVDMASFLS